MYLNIDYILGGGLPPQAKQHSQIDLIIEAVLGPAVEGIPHHYDSDGTINNIIELKETDTLGLSSLSSEYNSEMLGNTKNTMEVTICNDDTKENLEEQPHTPSTSQDLIENTKQNGVEIWTDWTPKTLKRPLSECLKTAERKEGKSVNRRRPANENLQDEILKEKLNLVKLLKEKAEEEANLKIQILKEPLKQEKIKTEKLLKE
ncbi:hypothetical protein ACJJTC_012282 [Scirpophaga incertulas]